MGYVKFGTRLFFAFIRSIQHCEIREISTNWYYGICFWANTSILYQVQRLRCLCNASFRCL